ncbi:unnamed protein product, partial [Leptidea sinapis]
MTKSTVMYNVEIVKCKPIKQRLQHEKVGNRLDGYHPLQKTLYENSGTQCGYCSPGWVMAMYSLLKKKKMTMLEIEKSLGSNVCRCTGYRPILDAFKKFASDSPDPYHLPDIEDLKICKKSGDECSQTCSESDWCFIGHDDVERSPLIHIKLSDNKDWFRVEEIGDIYNIFKKYGADEYMLVAGNTAKGAYPILEYPRLLIDVSGVTALKGYLIDQNLGIGAGNTLTELEEIFTNVCKREYFSYLRILYNHLQLVAHIPVKNIGTIAGNLMTKHRHNDFKSDIFLLLETVGANVTIRDGLSPPLTRASKTERFLVGQRLFTNETLQGALGVLNDEIVVTDHLPEMSAAYRRQLALGLFYKGLLSLCPPNILGARYKSGAIRLREDRSGSDGRQIFDTNPALWPLNKPSPKSDGLIQCAGEATYTEDIPSLPNEVFAAFVLADIPLGTIDRIDSSTALAEPGVLAFYSAKDIPGENSYTPAGSTFYQADEEVLCEKEVKYMNQPIGIIVAENQHIADRAATLVKVLYKNIRKPVVDIKIAKNDPKRSTLFMNFKPTRTGSDVTKVIKGESTIYGQYHFTMETLACVSHPIEEGIKVYSTTQWIDVVQRMVAKVLKIEQNRIDVQVRRLGGAYGIKISRGTQVATACALVTFKLNRPCRFIQSLKNNMRAVGKRLPCSTNVELGVNQRGEIQFLKYELYSDNGYIIDEPLTALGLDSYYNCYDKSTWDYTVLNSITDTASNTWCRSPATLECIAMSEIIMERISYEANIDPFEVRIANLDNVQHRDILELVQTIKTNSDYEMRKKEIEKFNVENRWKKRGLRCSFLRWTPVGNQYFDINLAVYFGDGSVIITHAGIEMGQGVNTKAVQICAYLLKIPVEKIQIKPNETTSAPNSFVSGGSVTSQNVAIGVRKCCEELLRRLEPIKQKLNNPTWAQLIRSAYDAQIDLQVHGFTNIADTQEYNIYGVTLAEVEIDVLTGEWNINRVDLIEDVGQSVNPEIDIGQIEGAFVMGAGYWTTEELVYHPETGELLTDRTWEYWVPQARDIPQDFRIYFRKKSYTNNLIFGAKAERFYKFSIIKFPYKRKYYTNITPIFVKHIIL